MRFLLRATIGLLLIGLISACKQKVANEIHSPVSPTAFRTDIPPIQSRLPKLLGITKCYWQGTLIGADARAPGPSLEQVKGFIFLNNNEAMRIHEHYPWHASAVGWRPALDTSILGITPTKWLNSNEYASAIKLSFQQHVVVYFDPDHSLLYIEIER